MTNCLLGYAGIACSNHAIAIFTMVHLAEEGDKYCCSKCKSCHVDIYELDGKKFMACLDCGHEEEHSE